MRTFKMVIIILILLLLLISVLQNMEILARPVELGLNLKVVNLSTGPLPLYTLTLISFSLGLLISGVFGLVYRFRLRSEIKRIKRDLDEKEEELNSLRNLPLLESRGSTADKEPSGTGEGSSR